MMQSRSSAFFAGARDTLPLIIGAVPFGIVFGTLSGGAGLSAAATMGMSAFVFAGSAQFIAMGLVAEGTVWPLIVLTTAVVNFRHLLYTATLLPFLKPLPRRWQAVLAFGLTDETFAVAAGRWLRNDSAGNDHWYHLGSMVAMYTNWNICTIIGLVAGRMLQGVAGWGLDFAMVAAFIGMVLPYVKNRPTIWAVTVAGAGALAFHALPHKLGLMVASLAGIGAGVIAEGFQRQVEGTGDK